MTADAATPLPHIATGEADDPRPPIVFLHGFAGDALAWGAIQPRVEPTRRTIAFDLPGHGAARDRERGNAGIAARAVRRSLETLGIPRAHLVGHSMGGAVACLVAMKSPDAVASMTLIAPGGFGPEINARLLRRFAVAVDPSQLGPVLEGFFGFRSEVPADLLPLMAAVRSDPLLIDSFREIGEAILDGDGQTPLSLDRLADFPSPVRLVWGEEDNVVPCHQMGNAPEAFARHLLSGVGHMPHLERTDLVLRLILETVASGERRGPG